MTATTEPNDRTAPRYDDELIDERPVSLAPLFRTLWLYRQIIGFGIAGIVLLSLIGLLALMAWRGSERVGTLTFRVTFEGAERGTYPNGMAFSPAEIVAAPVLTEVFDKNGLQQYGRFEDFKSAVSVVEANEAIDLLTLEYQAKLSEPRLTAADRARLEEEFRRKRDSLRDPRYALTLRRTERFRAMPGIVVGKVLTDILNTWAAQAAERKGALKYNIPTFSKNILPKDLLSAEDYIIGIDIVRSKVNRILRNIDQISTLPGSQIVRVGEARVSLAEVRANLEDVLRFKLQPLIGFIQSSGLSKDPRMLTLYMENQLFQIKLDRQQAASRVQKLQESLRDYVLQKGGTTLSESAQAAPEIGTMPSPGGTPAMIPQFGESFLDRLIELSTRNNDVQYRQELTDRIIEESLAVTALDREQAYYEDLSRSFRSAGGRAAGSRRAPVELVDQRLKGAIAEISTAIDHVNAIYDQLSKQNLNPSTLLYTTTRPVSVTTARRIDLRTVVLLLALAFVLALVFVPVVCLVHHYFLREVIGRFASRGPAAER